MRKKENMDKMEAVTKPGNRETTSEGKEAETLGASEIS